MVWLCRGQEAVGTGDDRSRASARRAQGKLHRCHLWGGLFRSRCGKAPGVDQPRAERDRARDRRRPAPSRRVSRRGNGSAVRRVALHPLPRRRWAVGLLGDPLRRGRAVDDPAQRLPLSVLGERAVFLQASADDVDPGAGNADRRHQSHRWGARHLHRVGHAAPLRALVHPRAGAALVRAVPLSESPRRARDRIRPGNDAALFPSHSPIGDRHPAGCGDDLRARLRAGGPARRRNQAPSSLVVCVLFLLRARNVGEGIARRPGACHLRRVPGARVVRDDAKSWEEHFLWLISKDFRQDVEAGRRPMPALWDQFFKMRLGSGLLVFAAVALPWYVAMLLTADGVDGEGKTFLARLIHDNFNRLAVGVHTTTPGGTFIYFIEQGGLGTFPWVALIPGALAGAARFRPRSGSRVDYVGIIASIWSAGVFLLVALSATKFHHYLLPALPGLAILVALFIDRLWEDGIPAHAMSLVFGLVLFILVGKDLSNNPKNFTDLFVYNYDRPYPFEMVQRPISLFGSRGLWAGDLLALVLIGTGAYLLLETFAAKGRVVYSRALALLLGLVGTAILLATATRGRISAMLFIGLALALVALYLGWELGRAEKSQRGLLLLSSGAVGLAALVFVAQGVRSQNFDPLLPNLLQGMNIKTALGFAFAVAGTLCAVAALMRSRVLLFGSFWALAFAFALWFNWSHWVDLSHHWTQRDLFWRYYSQRKPDEPIAAFMMNWRGETFYSKNTVKQIKESPRLTQYASLPGRKWALVEHNRLQILKNAVGPEKTVNTIDRDLNNKFVLVTFE